MERRDFVGHVAGLALGMAGAAGLDIDRLLTLLPQTEPTGSHHIGTADVEIIEQVTAAFRSQDFSHGSGPICDAAVAQLRATLPLHAAQGDAAGCDRAQGQAVEQLGRIDPATAPPWTAYVGKVGTISGGQGAAHYTLARTGRDPRAADRAVSLLREAVPHFGPGYARLGAIYLPNLAGAHALAGDLDTAIAVGHEAVDAVTAVSSPRSRDRLRELHTALEPMSASPGVAELRERLVTTTAA